MVASVSKQGCITEITEEVMSLVFCFLGIFRFYQLGGSLQRTIKSISYIVVI